MTGLNFDSLPMQVYHLADAHPDPMYTVKITPCGFVGRYMRVTDTYLRWLSKKSISLNLDQQIYSHVECQGVKFDHLA